MSLTDIADCSWCLVRLYGMDCFPVIFHRSICIFLGGGMHMHLFTLCVLIQLNMPRALSYLCQGLSELHKTLIRDIELCTRD